MRVPSSEMNAIKTKSGAQLGLLPDGSRATPRFRVWRRFGRHKLAVGAAIVLLVLLAVALSAQVIAPYDPSAINLTYRNQPPTAAHWLGTDANGRDVLTRLMFASRISLSVGVVAVTISVLIGVVLGAISGYAGQTVDNVIMRLTEVFQSFPTLIIIIILASILEPSIYTTMFVIGVFGWTGLARLVRAEFLSLRKRQFVEAALCLGVRPGQIIFRHMLPNTIAPITVNATFGVATAILTEASLSFLGLGVQAPTPSWGNMINAGRSLTALEQYPWLWLPPGLLIVISVLCINFLGDGLRDALDPRMSLD